MILTIVCGLGALATLFGLFYFVAWVNCIDMPEAIFYVFLFCLIAIGVVAAVFGAGEIVRMFLNV